MAAKRSSADPDPTHDLCLITDAYLAQLDPGLKYRSKILYQLSEIDSSVCRKIKQDLIVIEGILYINQLHLQLMLADLFLTDFKSILFLFAVCFLAGNILFICRANHRL